MKNEINLLKLDEKLVKHEMGNLEKFKHKLEKAIKLLSHEKYSKNKKEIAQTVLHILEQLHDNVGVISHEMGQENHKVFAKILHHAEKLQLAGADKELVYHYASVAKLFKVRYRLWGHLASHINLSNNLAYYPNNAIPYLKELIEQINKIESFEKLELKTEHFLEKDIEKVEHQ